MDEQMEIFADKIFRGGVQMVGHAFIDSQDPVAAVEDRDKVWNGVKGLLPLHLGSGNFFLRQLALRDITGNDLYC